MSLFGDALGFVKGVGEGAWDGVKGTVSGVGHLAQDGYKLATDSRYRADAWKSAVNDAKAVGNFAATAATDPGKAAEGIGNTAGHTWDALKTAYDQAAARGQGSEFIGQMFGQGAVLVGTALVPGGAEADALEAAGDAGRAAELLGDAGKATELATDASQAAAVTGDVSTGAAVTEDAGRAAAFEAPSGMRDVAAPRTPGLAERASMSDLVQQGAVPGADGVVLTDRISDPAELYGDMFKLSQQNGVEYALTREGDQLVLRSGAPNRVAIPSDAEALAHTHPFDPETQLPQKLPSRADVNMLNRRWNLEPDGPPPSSDVIWGSGPDEVTRYHATGLEPIPDPTRGGLKPGRTWR